MKQTCSSPLVGEGTRPEDTRVRGYRVGIGYDIHRLRKGRKLVIGGVRIPFEKGLHGHSDADVLCHSLCDAILGAVGEKDIGTWFPNTDEKYKGISSLALLEKVMEILSKKKFRVENVDSTVVAERPKLGKYFEEMKDKLSGVLGVRKNRIGLKATTNEGLGDIGRGRGICSFSVVLLKRR